MGEAAMKTQVSTGVAAILGFMLGAAVAPAQLTYPLVMSLVLLTPPLLYLYVAYVARHAIHDLTAPHKKPFTPTAMVPPARPKPEMTAEERVRFEAAFKAHCKKQAARAAKEQE